MESSRVHFLIDLSIAEGMFQDFESVVAAMTAETAKQAGAIDYEWFLSGDRRRCRLLETYANADAVQEHLNSAVVQELVPKLLGFSKFERVEVYGTLDAKATAALQAFGAEIYPHWKGLRRMPA